MDAPPDADGPCAVRVAPGPSSDARQEIAALRLAVLTLASRFNLAANDPSLIQNHMEAAVLELIRLQSHSPVLDRTIHLLDHWSRQVGPDASMDVASPDAVRGYLRELRSGTSQMSKPAV